MKRLVVTAALLVVALTTANAGATMPKIFHGEWCGKSDKPNSYRRGKCGEDNDGRFIVTPTGTKMWEGGCALQSLSPTKRENEYSAKSKCGGEGETWTEYALIGLHGPGHMYWISADRTDCKDDTGKKIAC